MPEAKTIEQRALAAISNKADEIFVRLERIEEILKLRERRPAPPRPAGKGASAAAA
jgi:hypothetical protein